LCFSTFIQAELPGLIVARVQMDCALALLSRLSYQGFNILNYL